MQRATRNQITRATIAATAILTVLATPAFAGAREGRLFRVTVTNLTRGQVLTPPVAVTHDRSVSLFRAGSPAGEDLAILAEEGVTGPLQTTLAGDPGVRDVVVGPGPIPPGASATIDILAGGSGRLLSVAGMLAVTNDAFFAVQDVRLRGPRGLVLHAGAYDAGTEGNSESCDHIPGPPCGAMGVRNTATAEGFVHVHAGIHGTGDLNPAMLDWRNPVALIRVELVTD